MDTRYSDIKTLGDYLVALLAFPELPSPVFVGRYPVCANGGEQKTRYRVDLTRLKDVAAAANPNVSSLLPVIPLNDALTKEFPSVTVCTGATRESNNNKLRDTVASYTFQQNLALAS
jgi:hypothetical protein